MKLNIEETMNEWWDKKHKEDIRCSGDFSWDEIEEFGKFLLKKINSSKFASRSKTK
jgi:hypothetical protein